MSSEIILAFIIGVLSGLAVNGLIKGSQSLLINLFNPWLENRFYQDAKVEGMWEGSIIYPGSGSEETMRGETLVFVLSRRSRKIFGEMKSNDKKIYNISGEIRNSILTLTYSSKEPHAIDRGCFTFMLKENGRMLQGGCSIYHSVHDKIATASISLYRLKEHN
jgi:hypothetical protein